jgi:hypothetical protein
MFLYHAYKSCHHGHCQKENQLDAVKTITKHYDMIEIDFVYFNNQYISSHDYDVDTIKNGSTLEEWIEYIILHNKILWIDLKDTNLNIFTYSTQLNIPHLINILDLLSLKYQNLKQHIILGCQFTNGYKQLLNEQHDYVVINDLPKDYMYALKYILPLTFVNMLTKYVIQNDSNIVAIDKSYFNTLEVLQQFIDDCTSSIIIIYNFEEGNITPESVDKHIIIQYNYK